MSCVSNLERDERVIELQHVALEHQGRPILTDVNFSVDRGEFVYLVGPTGSGKTTILKLILFESRPTRGVVVAGDCDSQSIRKADIPYLRRRMGVVFQNYKLLRDRTVFENVALALEVTGAKRSIIKRNTLSILTEVDLLHKRDAYPDQLSGGEQQRVAIARALVNNPLVLLADEPTANLDPETTDQVMAIFSKITARGTSVIMATHDTALVTKYPRRTLRLVDGRIEESHVKSKK